MPTPESVVVVGAGPVGSLLALMLARRGVTVDVYERRPDMRTQEVGGGRSINLAVSTRGLHALHSVGLDEEVLRQAVPMLGRMMHSLTGDLTFLRYGRDDSEFINSMSRGGLNRLLMDRAESAGPGRVRIQFRRRLTGYDFETKVATFINEESGAAETVHASVIIGSDGSASALRSAMERTGSLQISQEPLDAGYKELTLPPGDGSGPHGRFAIAPNALHIWPRGRFMLIALPNMDGSFTCTLFLPFESKGDEPSFARLRDADSAGAFFRQYFADAAGLLPNLEESFLAAPLGHMVTVKCTPWAKGTALLIGDAAHAIVPFFGQGMNAGFEDCTLLDEALAGSGGDVSWATLFSQFSAARRVDTDAIADLALENFVEMRDKVGDPVFLLHRAVEAELQRRFPGRYLSRYQMVTFSRIPYHAGLEAGRIQAEILAALCDGKVSAAEVDFDAADRLLRDRLEPIFRRNGIASAAAPHGASGQALGVTDPAPR